MRILPRGEILAPAFGIDRRTHDLAAVRRLELETDLAALLALRHELVVRVGVLDLVRVAQLVFCQRRRGEPACRGGDDGEDAARPSSVAAT